MVDEAAGSAMHRDGTGKIIKPDEYSYVDSEEIAIIPVPPDGGWGWVIIAICSFGNFSIDTLPISFPTMQTHLSELLNVTMPELSLIMSIYNCFCFVIGPFSGALANRLGFRLTMCCGALLASIGLLTCFFHDSYTAYVICMGVIPGFGGSFVYMVSMAAPGFWFDEKRAIAAGISTAASGLACIVIPIISAEIEKSFGWRYVLILPAGSYCVLTFFSLLIRTAPSVYMEPISPTVQKGMTKRPVRISQREAMFKNTSVVHLLGGGISEVKLKQKLPIDASTHLDRRLVEPVASLILREYPKKRKCPCFSSAPRTIERPMLKKDVFYQGSISRIRAKQNMTPGQYTLSVTTMPNLRDVREEVECRCTLFPEAIKAAMRTLFDFSVFKNKSFSMVLCSGFFLYNACYIPFMYLRRVGLANGMEDKYACLLTPIYGIGITTSRCTVGLLMMIFPKIGSLYFTSISLVFSVIFSLMVAFYFNVIYQMVFQFFYGYSAGIFLPMRSIILIDYVGLEKLTSAMGFIFTIQGFAAFSGILLAEVLSDHFHDTRWSLFYSAFSYSLSMIFIIPIFYFPMVKVETTTRQI